MKQENRRFVSSRSTTRATRNKNRKTPESFRTETRPPPPASTAGTKSCNGNRGASGPAAVNLRRLLIFFILISTSYCTPTTSLSPLGLYKVGVGATNLIENILAGSTNSGRTKPIVTESSSGIVHQSRGVTLGNSESISKEKHSSSSSTTTTTATTNNNNNSSSSNTKKTNKTKRRDKNKNSLKRSNSRHKKNSGKEKTVPGTKGSLRHSESKEDEDNQAPSLGEDSEEEDGTMLRIRGLSEDDQKFLDRVQTSARTVRNWDADEELLKKCRSHVPWEELADDAHEKYANAVEDRFLRSGCGADSNALFLQRLCRWFPTFMTWVNAPPCSVCGCKDTEMKTVRGPESAEEIDGEARRVEVYYCPDCKANTTTFPRYNKASKLLETRRGRCGEYANLFGLFCRSVGFETRMVLDWSDHLWTEVRLGDAWVMADGCEGTIDKASMYEHGWGKDSFSYMIGIGADHVVDVTPRYTRKFMTADLQTRRREHTTSEEVGESMLQKLNEHMRTNPTVLPKSRVEELVRRLKLEHAELQQSKQATEWTDQEKYGSGRISGSLAWKQSRREDGNKQDRSSAAETNSTTTDADREVAGFPAEAFVPARLENGRVSFRLRATPTGRHDGIVVSETPCAVGVKDSVSLVVVDDNHESFGCILQSKSFVDWSRIVEFLDRLPAGRIVLMNGKIEIGNETKAEHFYGEVKIPRLGGWNGEEVAREGVLFAGQVDAHPDWTFCEPLKETKGYEFEIELQNSENGSGDEVANLRLRTERASFPQRIAGRLPEAFMPLTTQQNGATEREKREAYLRFAKSHGGRYCGYTTRKNSPVYLLNSTAYPLQTVDAVATNILGEDVAWNTFLELPEPLVPTSDCGIDDAPSSGSSRPIYDVPLDSSFFRSSLGPHLLSGVDLRMDTADALSNARLIALYFSAHWCGPCRGFTPMLAELYDHLSETFETHGLEVVFVSGDRDQQSFNQYYRTMPWKAIPFDQLEFVKQSLNVTYGVRGIPSLVVLDAVSGEAVVSASDSRQEVVTACRGGDLRIEAMFQSWLGRSPASTKELLSMIEMSAREMETGAGDEKDSDPDENPYLKRTLDGSEGGEHQEISIRFKAEFEKLVLAGHDPNTAAATALTTVSKIPVEELVTTIPPGKLDGKAAYAGEPRPERRDGVDQALAHALERNAPSSVAEVLSIGLKYLQNSRKTPWEPKYRRFKLSNKVADKITRVEGGLGLLQSLGFEVIPTYRDFEASIPVAADLAVVDEKMTKLLKELEGSS